MKNLLSILFISFLLYSCVQTPQRGYEINGNIANVGSGQAVLTVKQPDSLAFTDTAEIKNGAFRFKGSISDPVYAVVQVKPEGDKQVGVFSFILENNKIKLDGDYAKLYEYYGEYRIPEVEVTGGPNNALLQKLMFVSDSLNNQPKYEAFNIARKELEVIRKENPDAYHDALAKFNETTASDVKKKVEEYHSVILALIKENPDVEYAASLIPIVSRDMNLVDLEDIFNTFTPRVQQSFFANDIRNEIAGLRATAPGSVAPDFTLKLPDGTDFTLSSLKGKYVLVDFWASWCIPCRKAVPELIELYKSYKDKGFEIVGVANDSNLNSWKKAIEEDKTTWIHVVDVFPIKNKPSYVSTLYAVHSLPTYYLIDRDGKIIGKMEKDEVKKKLKELFQ